VASARLLGSLAGPLPGGGGHLGAGHRARALKVQAEGPGAGSRYCTERDHMICTISIFRKLPLIFRTVHITIVLIVSGDALDSLRSAETLRRAKENCTVYRRVTDVPFSGSDTTNAQGVNAEPKRTLRAILSHRFTTLPSTVLPFHAARATRQ